MDESSRVATDARGFRRWATHLKVTWLLLLVIAAFPILAALLDVGGVVRAGIPTDHARAFAAVSGAGWESARASSGIAKYVSLLEVGYAVHELVFGLIFLVVVAIPFRQGARWAWFACWTVLIADLTYALTFGAHDPTLFRQAMIAVIATPVLLLAQAPRFFGARA